MNPPILHIIPQVQHDPKYLAIGDYSDWGILENRPAIIEITVAGAATPITTVWQKGASNSFNSISLYLTTYEEGIADLPDGLYKLKLIGSPDSYNHEIDYLRDEKLRKRASKFLASQPDPCAATEAIKNQLMKFELYKWSYDAKVRMGKSCEAMDMYNKAVGIINDLEASCSH